MSKIYEPLPAKITFKTGAGSVVDAVNKPFRREDAMRVLVYHNITDGLVPKEWPQMTTPKELFDRQMRYLKENGYNVVPAEQIVSILNSSGPVPSKTISITFDDGYRDNYKNAFPILKRYGLRGTIFITTDFIGKPDGPFYGYLNWEEIEDMKNSGTFTFGCHSLSHRNLCNLNDRELNEEIETAKDIMEDRIRMTIDSYAYPFGWHSAFNKNVVDVLKKRGFLCGFTGIYGANNKSTDPFYLRRLRVSWLDDIEEFEKMLHGSYDWYSIYQRMVSVWKKP